MLRMTTFEAVYSGISSQLEGVARGNDDSVFALGGRNSQLTTKAGGTAGDEPDPRHDYGLTAQNGGGGGK